MDAIVLLLMVGYGSLIIPVVFEIIGDLKTFNSAISTHKVVQVPETTEKTCGKFDNHMC